MPDKNFDLSQLFNHAIPTMREYWQQEADRTAQVPPQLDVPVRVVPPPVTLKGQLSFIATFPSDLIYGRPYEQVIQMIMDAFQSAGLETNPLLPELRIHNVQAWREEIERKRPEELGPDGHAALARAEQRIRDYATERGDVIASDALAGIREDGPGGGEEHPTDPGEGDADDPGNRG